MKNKCLLGFLGFLSFNLYAMEDDTDLFKRPVGAYGEELLTIDIVEKHAPKLPDDIIAQLAGWFTSKPELIERLIVQDFPLSEYKGRFVADRDWLAAQEDLHNLARSNYIFEDPSGRYIVKISGISSRLQNQIVANGIPRYHTKVSDEEVAQLSPFDTYQTISYIPVFLRYCELQRLRPLRFVHVPDTFLLHVPGRPDVLCDKNYVIVQEKQDLVSREIALTKFCELKQEQIYELVLLIFYCGLWNMRTNVHLTPGGMLVVNDLEQPNVTSPEGFYLQDVRESHQLPFFGKDRFKRNVEAGIRELYALFAPDSEQAAWIKGYALEIANHYNKNFEMKIVFDF
ncbi:TPA: hypothetical protein DIC20_01465 [Candidatus Dependentiae bacterium]|nr:MAG: hypothetical protein US03_C0002G0098 [candidate division TM6 bacterium GW2011_GWF2_36_131]KKQ03531.1 MAG: hypothetical protein US13_C0002G0097 [candidate division TM6 bacterium GW2011_GWE2_36_25]KKQ20194.1 MAG: hypothetical protein US32_C0001G0091 [candidate division TM6 bacterium GW2011_GWA2_36_9]HBR70734.1 hypothetical protein [Candidatus Dependentiae bacterium]HCU00354.1 hypothetical protein [Candidatus Dependentiae bacterium]